MSTIEIHPLDTKDTDKIIEIFSSAFENYPLMEFFFGNQNKESIKHLIKPICNQESLVENLILGAFAEGKLQGFAFVTPPEKSTNDREVEKTASSSEEELAKSIGEEAGMRMEAYSNLRKANKPPSPHFYINILAVHPQSQGKGIGKVLLAKVHQISEEDPISSGVALDTQSQENVDYYQRFGYRITSTAELQNVKNWFMFQPD